MIAGLGLLDLLAAALILAGGLVAALAAIGLLRLPDHYLRAHCAAALAVAGAPLILAGVLLGALAAGEAALAGRLALLFALSVALAPLNAHLAAAAAYSAGVTPSLDPAADARAGDPGRERAR